MESLHSFSGLTGEHLGRLSAVSCSWSESISEEGSMSGTVEMGRGVRDLLRPYGTIVALVDGSRVVHAGYVTGANPDATNGTVAFEAGGGMTILSKRLVLDRALIGGWRDGYVVIDEDNPPGSWVMTLRGTYSDIARGLVDEALAWGELPIDLPAVQGGSAHERTYNSWDFATVSERLGDLADLDDGPEIRFDPSLGRSWKLRFSLRVADEIVDRRWSWNAAVPGSGVVLEQVDSDGSDLCSQAYLVGGGEEDSTLMARSTSSRLTSRGWPLLQVANTSHASVSVLSTLQSYARGMTDAGDEAQETFGVSVPSTWDVRPGDWADVFVPAFGWSKAGVVELKVVDVSGKMGGGRLSVQLRRR